MEIKIDDTTKTHEIVELKPENDNFLEMLKLYKLKISKLFPKIPFFMVGNKIMVHCSDYDLVQIKEEVANYFKEQEKSNVLN